MRIPITLVALIALVGTVGCTKGFHKTVLLDHSTPLGNDWLTVRFPKPLNAEPGEVQEILASIPTPHEKTVQGEFGLRMPDGAVIWPECQIESETGEWFPLTGRAFWGDDLVLNGRALSDSGRSYIAVKLKSAQPITVSRLVWDSYDPREVKR